ncbi:family 16 glycoside hydrolase [Pedobacter aquatilis]|uniref:family 16 glycoside hydrolase n=1 Tax=Pedobacter aquatilis TaxID=351343 RepID=UPI00292DA9F5|nr:family 16 glycoside hydrolase [Pedobacter aquatilis]
MANLHHGCRFERNHTIQYFAYPGYSPDNLRRDKNGEYESYADIGLNEWIKVRIEVSGEKASLYINGQKSPSFIVNKPLVKPAKGAVGLWVEIGTIGYFRNIKVRAKDN